MCCLEGGGVTSQPGSHEIRGLPGMQDLQH